MTAHTADTEVAVDPAATSDPPLEIRIIPAPALWTDINPAHMVPVFGTGNPNPVMHRWGKVTAAGGIHYYHMACGRSTPAPVSIRYDHARRFARHCQTCTRIGTLGVGS